MRSDLWCDQHRCTYVSLNERVSDLTNIFFFSIWEVTGEEAVMSFDSSALVHSLINDMFGYLEPDTVVMWHCLKHTEAVCGSGFEAYTAVTNLRSGPCWYLHTRHAHLSSLLSSCLSLRSLMYGRCTRSVAGSSSLLVTVSGNSMKISSTDLLSEQQTLYPFPLSPVQGNLPSLCSPSDLSHCSLRSRQGPSLCSTSQCRRNYSTSPASSTGPHPKPSSQLFLIQTVNSASSAPHFQHTMFGMLLRLCTEKIIRLYAV